MTSNASHKSDPRADSASRRVVIIGAGFGGLFAAKALADAPVQVTVIDRTNHHLFQPLLYQVAMTGLSPAEIAERTMKANKPLLLPNMKAALESMKEWDSGGIFGQLADLSSHQVPLASSANVSAASQGPVPPGPATARHSSALQASPAHRLVARMTQPGCVAMRVSPASNTEA